MCSFGVGDKNKTFRDMMMELRAYMRGQRVISVYLEIDLNAINILFVYDPFKAKALVWLLVPALFGEFWHLRVIRLLGLVQNR